MDQHLTSERQLLSDWEFLVLSLLGAAVLYQQLHERLKLSPLPEEDLADLQRVRLRLDWAQSQACELSRDYNSRPLDQAAECLADYLSGKETPPRSPET